MNIEKSMIATEIEEVALIALHEWHSLISTGQIKKVRDKAQVIVDKCKSLLKDIELGEIPEKCNKALILGILFRGLQDFIDLSETINPPNWKNEPSLIEKAWIQMWDCKERIEYASHFYNERILDWVLRKIDSLEQDFLANFGTGLYSSPEILIKREICSICNNDFRSCEHISGGIYNGLRCVSIPQDFELRSVSIVEVPEDPRCRIWPWQLKEGENKVIDTCIRLDDFMNELDEKD